MYHTSLLVAYNHVFHDKLLAMNLPFSLLYCSYLTLTLFTPHFVEANEYKSSEEIALLRSLFAALHGHLAGW
jgi:hypothetical protein